MEVRSMDENQKEIVSKVIALVNDTMGYIDLFEPNRPASIATTKLEEAVMWIQVMVANCKLKEVKKEEAPLEGELLKAS